MTSKGPSMQRGDGPAQPRDRRLLPVVLESGVRTALAPLVVEIQHLHEYRQDQPADAGQTRTSPRACRQLLAHEMGAPQLLAIMSR
jgi:hypothetical protein